MSFLHLLGLCPKTPRIPTSRALLRVRNLWPRPPFPSVFGFFRKQTASRPVLGVFLRRQGLPEFIQQLPDAVGCQGNALHPGSFSALGFLWYPHHAASCSLSSGPHHPPSGAVHSAFSRSSWSVSEAEILGPHLGPSKLGSFQKLRGLWVQPLFRQSWARSAVSGTAQASLNSAEPCRAQPPGHSSDPMALGYFRNRSSVPAQPSRGHRRDPSPDPIPFGYFRN